jgi:hypothetical protein
MIQANELRIGNWIADRGGKEWQIDHWEYKDKVSSKPDSFVLPAMSMTNSFHPYTEYLDYLQPIPLTEEWLIRFGFTPDHNDYFLECEEHGVELEASWSSRNQKTGESYGWHISKYKHVKHVHSLQNLYFALTGEELETK